MAYSINWPFSNVRRTSVTIQTTEEFLRDFHNPLPPLFGTVTTDDSTGNMGNLVSQLVDPMGNIIRPFEDERPYQWHGSRTIIVPIAKAEVSRLNKIVLVDAIRGYHAEGLAVKYTSKIKFIHSPNLSRSICILDDSEPNEDAQYLLSQDDVIVFDTIVRGRDDDSFKPAWNSNKSLYAGVKYTSGMIQAAIKDSQTEPTNICQSFGTSIDGGTSLVTSPIIIHSDALFSIFKGGLDATSYHGVKKIDYNTIFVAR